MYGQKIAVCFNNFNFISVLTLTLPYVHRRVSANSLARSSLGHALILSINDLHSGCYKRKTTLIITNSPHMGQLFVNYICFNSIIETYW